MSGPASWPFLRLDDYPSSLLERHLNRTGARAAAQQDPHAALQLNMLRWLLDLVHSACDDEHLDPEVTRRILDKVIYGGVPQRPVVEQLLTERAQFTEHMATYVRPTVGLEETPNA